MNTALPYAVFVFAIGVVFASRRGSTWLGTVAWIALAAGFSFLQWGEASLGAAVAVAAFAGFAAMPWPDETAARPGIVAFGAVVPVAAAIGAVVCVRDATPIWGGKLVLFAAAWGALFAAFSCFLSAAGTRHRPLSASIPLTVSIAALSVWIAGTGRSSLPDAFYGFSLRAGEEPLMWVLDPTPRFPSGMRLSVAVPVPEMEAALIALLVAGAVGVVASLLGRTKLVTGAIGLAGLLSVVALAGLSTIVGSLTMPPGDAYSDEVKRRLLASGGSRITDTGAFDASSEISVAMADLAPEIVGLSVIAVIALVTMLLRADEAPDETSARALSRELLVRAVAFLWTAWFLLLIVHNSLLGAPGMGSPGEWVFTGACIMITGMVLMSWNPARTKLGRVLEELLPGLALSALLVAAGLAWRFGALPGLSLGIFE